MSRDSSIEPYALRASFGNRLFDVATSFVREGRVHIIHAGQAARMSFGLIKLPNQPTIRVSVSHDPQRSGRGAYEGTCSRHPQGGCEHVLAVILASMGSPRPGRSLQAYAAPSPPSPSPDAEKYALERWFFNLLSTVEPGRVNRTPSKHRLLYRLAQSRLADALTVEPLWAYVRKDGGYGAVKSVALDGASSNDRLDNDDREILTALAGHASNPTNRMGLRASIALDPSSARRLLAQLLETGRAHWNDIHAPPLDVGESRDGRLCWRADEQGRQRPVLEIDGVPEAIALPIEPLWYVDPQRHRAGPLELDLPPRIAIAMLRAPALSPANAERVRTQLETMSTRVGSTLPLPQAIAPGEVCREAKAHVQLRGMRSPYVVPDSHGTIPTMPFVKLSFDYGGLLISDGDLRESITRMVDGQLVSVERDFEQEDRAAELLEEMGLLPLDTVGLPSAERERLAGAYLPEAFGDDLAQFFLDFGVHGVPQLRQRGWVVEIDEDYPLRMVEGELDWYAEVVEKPNAWFDLELGVEIDGERHSLLPILVNLIRSRQLQPQDLADDADKQGALAVRLADGRFIMLPAERMRVILGTLIELYGDDALGARGELSLATWNAPRLEELGEGLGEGRLRWSGGERLRELAKKLRAVRKIESVEVPDEFGAQLRAYQLEGVSWLQFLREHELSGILADDMGLGKTVQLLAHLVIEKHCGRLDRPALVVAPTSVIANWRAEAERFAPDLRVLVLHGQTRKTRFDQLHQHDLVLTTYPLLARDEDVLVRQPYHLLVLDEAQFVKNAKTKAAGIAGRLEARQRLCLTGTPMENHLGELWSLFHIVMPGLLGDARQFRKIFRTPIEKHGDVERRDRLAARIRPFLLRRTKEQVASELPAKTEITRSVELQRAQRDLYESIRLAMNDKVRREIARKGMARSTIVILDALLKLRQVCCDPRLLKIREARSVGESAKLGALFELLEPLLDEGRRILLFSQFTSMIDLIEPELERRGIAWIRLTGQTRDRETPVRRFQCGEVPLFLISLKAGGTGLNLTAADTVIHYDPWWNPAVEDQATDRAHRIGQDKPVFVYRLIVAGSVEEKMLALQDKKRALVAGIHGASSGGLAQLSEEDLAMLFEPLA